MYYTIFSDFMQPSKQRSGIIGNICIKTSRGNTAIFSGCEESAEKVFSFLLLYPWWEYYIIYIFGMQ